MIRFNKILLLTICLFTKATLTMDSKKTNPEQHDLYLHLVRDRKLSGGVAAQFILRHDLNSRADLVKQARTLEPEIARLILDAQKANKKLGRRK